MKKHTHIKSEAHQFFAELAAPTQQDLEIQWIFGFRLLGSKSSNLSDYIFSNFKNNTSTSTKFHGVYDIVIEDNRKVYYQLSIETDEPPFFIIDDEKLPNSIQFSTDDVDALVKHHQYLNKLVHLLKYLTLTIKQIQNYMKDLEDTQDIFMFYGLPSEHTRFERLMPSNHTPIEQISNSVAYIQGMTYALTHSDFYHFINKRNNTQ